MSPLIRLIINHWFLPSPQHWCARCGTSWIISTLLGKTWGAGGVIENECVIINPGHMLSVERWKGADQLLRSVSNHDPGSLLQLQHWTTNRPLHTWWLQHYIWHSTTIINHQMSHHHQHPQHQISFVFLENNWSTVLRESFPELQTFAICLCFDSIMLPINDKFRFRASLTSPSIINYQFSYDKSDAFGTWNIIYINRSNHIVGNISTGSILRKK